MKTQIIKFLKDEEGATAIEYGLIAGIIAVAIIASLGNVRTELDNLFGRIVTALKNAGSTGGTGTN
ncbi:Flp family type IVb pilin [uncultured Oxalicibacterium sp.]|uniref:Flp family type IVb pilin n=1 Tax=uncultured Oxalicibacterium sp. TaxID=1168540 RepID=UPI0025F8203A|nr:Flp family type IVb pilin [uncultured Oxalicibacterium sp.]